MAKFCEPVIAVFGAGAEALMAQLPPAVTGVVNPLWQAGMLTSLQVGFSALPKDCDAAFFTLVDHPAVQPATLAALLRTNSPVAIPRCDGRRGHPVLVRQCLFDEIRLEPSTSQVRDIVNRHAEDIVYVEVVDPGIFDDIDDPRLYRMLLDREAAK